MLVLILTILVGAVTMAEAGACFPNFDAVEDTTVVDAGASGIITLQHYDSVLVEFIERGVAARWYPSQGTPRVALFMISTRSPRSWADDDILPLWNGHDSGNVRMAAMVDDSTIIHLRDDFGEVSFHFGTDDYFPRQRFACVSNHKAAVYALINPARRRGNHPDRIKELWVFVVNTPTESATTSR